MFRVGELFPKLFPEQAFSKSVIIIISFMFENPLFWQVGGQLSFSLDISKISSKSLKISS